MTLESRRDPPEPDPEMSTLDRGTTPWDGAPVKPLCDPPRWRPRLPSRAEAWSRGRRRARASPMTACNWSSRLLPKRRAIPAGQSEKNIRQWRNRDAHQHRAMRCGPRGPGRDADRRHVHALPLVSISLAVAISNKLSWQGRKKGAATCELTSFSTIRPTKWSWLACTCRGHCSTCCDRMALIGSTATVSARAPRLCGKSSDLRTNGA